ncbi:Brp/Blh family beta-carotene 15,15'-dioxygenase, partial [Candidatus Pelagibacter bacterium]|nr:Brp/Blh family beta-carotene 15,15'-dioxygenase [Candidatus Pelagibacter bacterium]
FLDLIENTKIIPITFILSTLSCVYLFSKNFKIINIGIFFDLTPLLAFTFYFCFLHSIRHSISLIVDLNQINLKIGVLIFIKKVLPLTVLTAIICLIALFFLSNSYVLDNAILKVIFIGLASLTFPHILLEYLLEKNEK